VGVVLVLNGEGNTHVSVSVVEERGIYSDIKNPEY